MLETTFRDQILEVCRLHGHVAYAVLDQAHFAKRTVSGWPDLEIIRLDLGVVAYAELKTVQGSVRQDQRVVLSLLRLVVEDVYLWRPGDFDGICGWLEGRRRYAPGRWVCEGDVGARQGKPVVS